MKIGKIKEYLNLLPKGFKNIDKIAEGIYNNVKLEKGTLPEDQQEEIFRRRLICSTCPFMSKNAHISPEYFDLIGEHYESYRGSEHCTLCSCPIRGKTAALSSQCGIAVWNEEHPDKKQELKWTNYVTQDS